MLSRKQSKFIKSLKIKKFRDREGAFIIEGRKNVLELINSDFKTLLIACSQRFMDELSYLENKKYEVFVCSEADLSSLGTFKANQECIAVAEMKPKSSRPPDRNEHIFLLDNISDPGNLGTIIRTLDWFGYSNLICSENTVDFYNPKVINATMGSFTRVVPIYTDLVSFVKASGLELFGADLHGEDLSHLHISRPSMFLLGSESHGISRELEKHIHKTFTIKGFGQAESLNVAIATGIISHHLRN